MVEIYAAALGSAVTVAGLAVSGLRTQSQQGRDSLVRLTVAVDNLSRQLDVLHTDMKSVDQEIFARLGALEQAMAKVEGHANRN